MVKAKVKIVSKRLIAVSYKAVYTSRYVLLP
jgi:hypothetical protein